MKEIRYIIKDKLGLHARPAGLLVKAATKFDSEIEVGTENKMVNSKSILGIMSLGIKTGDTLIITINGEDEEQAQENLQKFLEDNL